MNSCAPFVRKTFQLVSDQTTDSIVSWSASGKSFTIWDTPSFQKHILPQYFKHNNLCSFIRQLNTYGFHKVNAPESVSGLEFSHSYFRFGGKHLLSKISRKSPKTKKKQPKALKAEISFDRSSITDERVAQTILDLVKRQKESEQLLISVCKELEETRNLISTLRPSEETTITSGKRTRDELDVKCPPAKKMKCEFNEESIKAWPLTFDDLFQESATCGVASREQNFDVCQSFDISQILLDF